MNGLLTEELPKTGHRGGSTRGVRIGTVVALGAGGLLVEYSDNRLGPLDARTIIPVTPKDVGREVLLLFERNNGSHPIVIGFLLDNPAGQQEVVAAPAKVEQVTIDGECLKIEAKREILLQCGEGSILMRADGKVIIKGIDVTTRARGLNKVKGAAVKIN